MPVYTANISQTYKGLKNFEPKLYFGADLSANISQTYKGLKNFEAKLYLCAGLHGELVFDPKESFPNFNLKFSPIAGFAGRTD